MSDDPGDDPGAAPGADPGADGARDGVDDGASPAAVVTARPARQRLAEALAAAELPVTRVLGSALTGVACLLPVPFVGTVVIGLVRRRLCALLLRRHGRTFSSRDLRPFYGEPLSILGLPWRLLRELILKPIKRALHLVFFFLGIRDIALEIGKTLALALILDRMLAGGSFANDSPRKHRRHEAARLRDAANVAYDGIDTRLVLEAVSVMRRLPGVWLSRLRREGAPASDTAMDVTVDGHAGSRSPDSRSPDSRSPDSRIPDSRSPDSRSPDKGDIAAVDAFFAELHRRVDLALLDQPVDR